VIISSNGPAATYVVAQIVDRLLDLVEFALGMAHSLVEGFDAGIARHARTPGKFTPTEGSNVHHVAEVLGRYSNLGTTGVRVLPVWERATREVRSEPWQAPNLTGVTRVRQAVLGLETEILAEYATGTGSTTLARMYGISETAMLAWLHRHGAEIHTFGRLTPQDTIEMARLRQEGWTLRAIGERYAVTRQAVAMRLQRRRSDE